MPKKFKYFVVSLLVFVCAAMPFQPVLGSGQVKVFYRGSEIFYDVPPQIIHERAMVPLRTTIETITGQQMEWNANTKTVTFHANGHTNTHTIGQTVVYMDGVAVNFDTPSLIIDERTLVPIRMIAETSGCKVDWDSLNKYVIITSPLPVTPQPNATASISSVTASRTTINSGDSTELTIKTNSAANYVWVDDGFSIVYATYRSVDTAGIKTWTVTSSPSASRSMTVYANTTQNATGAVTQSIYITVNASNALINSLSTNKTTITGGDSITFTIKTTTSANYVWVEYDSTYKSAELQSTSGGVKTWTATIYPETSQRARVYAHTSSRSTSGADSQTQSITVNAQATLKIQSVSASKTTIATGEAVTLTIKTSSNANYVWVSCDSTDMYADYISGTNPKTWSITVYPSETQRLRIYANTSSSQSGAVNEIQNITVNSAVTPKIVSFNTTKTAIQEGETFGINVTTNTDVDYLWAESDYGDSWAGDVNNADGTNKYWTIICDPTETGTITVYASVSGSKTGAATRATNIVVTKLMPAN